MADRSKNTNPNSPPPHGLLGPLTVIISDLALNGNVENEMKLETRNRTHGVSILDDTGNHGSPLLPPPRCV